MTSMTHDGIITVALSSDEFGYDADHGISVKDAAFEWANQANRRISGLMGNTIAAVSTRCFCTAGPYTMLRRTDIKGNDINCNYKDYNGVAQDYCEVSGDFSTMVSACNDNPACQALVVESDYSGYLKATSTSAGKGPLREGYVTYVKSG